MPDPVDELLARLTARIHSYGASRLMVAFSGGVDSAVVLAVAARALGAERVTAVTALSPSYPRGELDQARRIAHELFVEHLTVDTAEVEMEAYARNDALRCFHCKNTLYTSLRRLATVDDDGRVILAGANADDASDFRPGLLAAERHRVRNPLLEESVGKEEVRAIARRLGLEVAEKPALACLSSRVVYGIRVTPDLLARIDQAEQHVRALGFSSVRVRHFGDACVVEVPGQEIARLVSHPDLDDLTASLHALGWPHVTVDLEGQRAGSMNASLIVAPGLQRRLSRLSVR